jgi:hypothetical protein
VREVDPLLRKQVVQLEASQVIEKIGGRDRVRTCLQSKLQNAMWLYRLAFTYVLHDGFRWYSAVVVPILFPRCCVARSVVCSLCSSDMIFRGTYGDGQPHA